MLPVDICDWAEGRIPGGGFYVDRFWQHGQSRWELRKNPIRLSPRHADILRTLTTPLDDGRLPFDQAGWCESAKSGKSAVGALLALYGALHWDGDVIISSNRQNQAASLTYKSAVDAVAWNPHLSIEPYRYEMTFANGNQIRAIPVNARGAAGSRFSLYVSDEIWGAVYTDAVRQWDEHKVDPTRLRSMRLAIGYAGYLESKLWLDILQSGMGEPVPELSHITDPDGSPCCWCDGRNFVYWSHWPHQPWQTDDWIESQRRSLRPAEFNRMILTQFSEGEGDFIEQSAWLACVDPSHKPLPPGDKEHRIYIGLDLALAPNGDDCALIGCYAEGGRVKTAFHKLWKGKDRKRELKLSETVEPFIKQLKRGYRISAVLYDPWQCKGLADNLRRASLRCIEVQQTHASRGPRDTELWEMIVNRELVLYDHPDMVNMVAGASARELGDGRIFLGKAGRGSRVDLLIALSLCASEARATQRRGGLTGEISTDLRSGYLRHADGTIVEFDRTAAGLARNERPDPSGRYGSLVNWEMTPSGLTMRKRDRRDDERNAPRSKPSGYVFKPY